MKPDLPEPASQIETRVEFVTRQLVKDIGGVRQGKVVADKFLIHGTVINTKPPLRLTRLRNHENRSGIRTGGGPNEAGGKELVQLIPARLQLNW